MSKRDKIREQDRKRSKGLLCSFCDTEGHPRLWVIPVAGQKKVSPSPTASVILDINYAGACDVCNETIREMGWFDRD